MGVFENFPYVNFHELNFAWMIAKIKELEDIIGTQIVDIVARAGVAANTQAINDLSTIVTNNATTAHNESLAAQNTANSALSIANTANGKADAHALALANVGKRTVTIYQTEAIGTTLAYIGVSFTITKTAIVRASLYYANTPGKDIVIAEEASGAPHIYAHGSSVTGITASDISTTALLAPGTYYIWASSTAAGNNPVGVDARELEP